MEQLIAKLNAKTADERLAALREIKALYDNGTLTAPQPCGNVNNHIHTIYSFSPYSPTAALYYAWQNGLSTAGIMDHDSIAGAKEFIEAGKIVGMAVTVGVECRVKFDKTPINGRRINNPDQSSVAYVALHGVPHNKIDRVNDFFAPYRAKRNERNKKMCANINTIMAKYGIAIDFDKDVLPLSMYNEGGSVTERHICYALVKQIVKRFPTPEGVIGFFKNDMGIALSAKLEGLLSEAKPEFYEYDILGVIKGNLVEKFYIDADEECPDVTEYIALAEEVGAVSAYAYLGDVGDSVTGDKKAQKFEDDYLDELAEVLKSLRFNSITYMPTRNTKPQLERLMALCDKYGFYQICGEDINSPRQKFICEALNDPMFAHLKDAAWALIGHEKLATADFSKRFFAPEVIAKYPLTERIKVYSDIAKKDFE